MTLVLRLIRQARWVWPDGLDWLAPGDIPADPLADFANTTENSLSVWFVADDKRDLDDVLAALAASREKADKLDYVLFREEQVTAIGVEVRPVSGHTPDDETNRAHRDLARLTAANVLALTTSVWQDHVELGRIERRRALHLVADAVRRGRVPPQKLSPRLREEVRPSLVEGDEPRKPR